MVTVGIIGDFDAASETHQATNKALDHAARALAAPGSGSVERTLKAFDALWAAPGSPYRSMEGALRGIRFARERGWPFVGT
jgi:CTP synthase (UTP-ammonia lyase)